MDIARLRNAGEGLNSRKTNAAPPPQSINHRHGMAELRQRTPRAELQRRANAHRCVQVFRVAAVCTRLNWPNKLSTESSCEAAGCQVSCPVQPAGVPKAPLRTRGHVIATACGPEK